MPKTRVSLLLARLLRPFLVLLNFPTCFYLTIRLWARDSISWYYIVKKGAACAWKSRANNQIVLVFIKSILKSLAILAMWLALGGVIYPRISLSVALNRIFFSANENGTVKQSNQSDFKAFFKLTNHIAGKWKTKWPLFGKFGDFKNCAIQNESTIKWQLNFGSWNFGLKSYLWFQIELALRVRSTLKSCVWLQAKLHSTQFKYHYKSTSRSKLYLNPLHRHLGRHFVNKRTLLRYSLSTSE